MRRRSGLAFAAIDLLGSLFLVALVQMAPPTRHASALRTQGEYAVVLTWPKKCDMDLDEYVREPTGEVVYFRHLNGSTVHLEHDDLGRTSGYQGQSNFERAIVRSIQPGEYTINAHIYQPNDCSSTIAKVELWRLRGQDRLIASRRLRMHGLGDEKTAMRFSLRRDGSVYGVNHLSRSLVGV